MREPSVTRLSLGVPSWVSWVIFRTRGGGNGRLSNTSAAEAARRMTAKGTTTCLNRRTGELAIALAALGARCDEASETVVETGTLSCRPESDAGVDARPVSESRFNRSKSARISAALWYR